MTKDIKAKILFQLSLAVASKFEQKIEVDYVDESTWLFVLCENIIELVTQNISEPDKAQADSKEQMIVS